MRTAKAERYRGGRLSIEESHYASWIISAVCMSVVMMAATTLPSLVPLL
ncbi:MAG: hypothetical protein ACREPM_05550 [Gemmatimonadaceae bacterium]